MAGLDFSKFKRNRKQLEKAVSKMKTDKPSYIDDRIWTPKTDKAGNADAILRFLPQQDLDKPPVVHWFQHIFKHRGQWFFENCPSTIEKPCYVCDYIKENNLWDEDEDSAKKFNRGMQFIANVLVVKDPGCPENEGKVMLFKFGFKINEKILAKTCPESDLDEPINVFDMWSGVNFRFSLKKVGGFNNYDSCEFQSKENAVGADDKAIEAIYNEIYDLDEFTAEKQFKDSSAIEKKFLTVIGASASKTTTSAKPDKEESSSQNDAFEEPENFGDDGDMDDFSFDDDDVPF